MNPISAAGTSAPSQAFLDPRTASEQLKDAVQAVATASTQSRPTKELMDSVINIVNQHATFTVNTYIKFHYSEYPLLSFMTFFDQKELVQIMLQKDPTADVNMSGRNDRTVFYKIVNKGWMDIANFIIDNFQDVDVERYVHKRTVGYTLIENGEWDLLKKLVIQRRFFKINKIFGSYPLIFHLIEKDQLDIVELIFRAYPKVLLSCDKVSEDSEIESIFHLMVDLECYDNLFSILRFLCENESNPVRSQFEKTNWLEFFVSRCADPSIRKICCFYLSYLKVDTKDVLEINDFKNQIEERLDIISEYFICSWHDLDTRLFELPTEVREHLALLSLYDEFPEFEDIPKTLIVSFLHRKVDFIFKRNRKEFYRNLAKAIRRWYVDNNDMALILNSDRENDICHRIRIQLKKHKLEEIRLRANRILFEITREQEAPPRLNIRIIQEGIQRALMSSSSASSSSSCKKSPRMTLLRITKWVIVYDS